MDWDTGRRCNANNNRHYLLIYEYATATTINNEISTDNCDFHWSVNVCCCCFSCLHSKPTECSSFVQRFHSVRFAIRFEFIALMKICILLSTVILRQFMVERDARWRFQLIFSYKNPTNNISVHTLINHHAKFLHKWFSIELFFFRRKNDIRNEWENFHSAIILQNHFIDLNWFSLQMVGGRPFFVWFCKAWNF